MAGLTTADLATVAIGPITPVYSEATLVEVGMDDKVEAEWIAGLIYGFTGDNNLPEIEACFHSGHDVITTGRAFLDDYIT